MRFLNFHEALSLLNNTIPTTQTTTINLSSSLGRIIAQDIIAQDNSPELPTSALDGYAIRSVDQATQPIEIVGINPAGENDSLTLAPNQAIKTFTGSLMPLGSDTLIPIENVTVADNHIHIQKAVPKGFGVRAIGENYAIHDLLIPKGEQIGFAHIGVMASLNHANVKVYTKPKVAILSTGSEILDLGESKTNRSQIYSSNHFVLEALTTQYGGEAIRLGVVKDDKTLIKSKIVEALELADIVVTTGGVSVGDFDFVNDILVGELGATVLFQKVAIKPGKHILACTIGSKYIIALPGFAYSSTVTFLMFVVPLIKRMGGAKAFAFEIINATLQNDYAKKSNFYELVAVELTNHNGTYHASMENKKEGSSAILTNMLGSTGLMICEEERAFTHGDTVQVIKI